ncbi:MAG: hypothetical protein HYY84_13275 [Deltaproteobacteria bacterium]|nr:hypothetical protein [Deltaproteobacteria bacterium]
MVAFRLGRKQLRRRVLAFMLASTTFLVGGLSILAVVVVRKNLQAQLEKRGAALSHATLLSSRLAFWTRDRARALDVLKPLFDSDADLTYIYLLGPDEAVLASVARDPWNKIAVRELTDAHRAGGSPLRLKDIGGRKTGTLYSFSETLYESATPVDKGPPPEEKLDDDDLDAGVAAPPDAGLPTAPAGPQPRNGPEPLRPQGPRTVDDSGARVGPQPIHPIRVRRLRLGAKVRRAAVDDEQRLLAEETIPGAAPRGESPPPTPPATAASASTSPSRLAALTESVRLPETRRPRVDTSADPLIASPRPLGTVVLGLSAGAIEAEARSILLVTLILAVSAVLLFTLVVQLASKGVFRRLTAMMDIAGGIARGDLSQRVDQTEADEIGVLGQALNGIGSSLSQMMGQTVDATERLQSAVRIMGELANEVAAGARAQFESVERTSVAMEGIAHKTREIAENVDVLNESTQRSSSSILEIVANNRAVVENLTVMNASVDETTASIEEMSRSIHEVAESVDGLHQEVERTSTAMTEMDAAIREVEGNAHATAELSEQTSRDAVQGSESVSHVLEGMRRIADANKDVTRSMVALSERLGAVGRIVSVIDDIAEQTNLLALNAAIIAAQAGPHGRGFAVVADEIKQLADKVGVSTREIRDLIASTEEEAGVTNKSVNQSAKTVTEGVRLSSAAESALKKILDSSDRSNSMMKMIARATQEQAKGSEEVTRAMERIATTVQQISHAMNEQAKGSELIARSAEKMREATQSVDRSTREQADGSAEVSRSLERIAEMVQKLSSAQSAQSKDSAAVSYAVEEVRRITEQHAKNMDQIRSAISTVESASEQLRSEIARFRV